jgi:hypothetical protein
LWYVTLFIFSANGAREPLPSFGHYVMTGCMSVRNPQQGRMIAEVSPVPSFRPGHGVAALCGNNKKAHLHIYGRSGQSSDLIQLPINNGSLRLPGHENGIDRGLELGIWIHRKSEILFLVDVFVFGYHLLESRRTQICIMGGLLCFLHRQIFCSASTPCPAIAKLNKFSVHEGRKMCLEQHGCITSLLP